MAIFYGAAYGGYDSDDYEVKAIATIISQNQTTKKTKYRITVDAKNISDSIGGYNNYPDQNYYENIVKENGVSVKNSSGYYPIDLSDIGDSYSMMDYTGEITHKADGTAVIDFYNYQAIDGIGSVSYFEIEDSWVLPSLYSNSIYTAADTMILNGTAAATYQVFSAGYTHNLTVHAADGTLLFTRSNIGGATVGTVTYNLLFSAAEQTAMRAKMTGPTANLKVSLETMLNGARYGGLSIQYIVVSSPSTDGPTAPTITLTEVITAVNALTVGTHFYKGISRIKATVTGGAAITGRTIDHYEMLYMAEATPYLTVSIEWGVQEVKTYTVKAYAVDNTGLKGAITTKTVTSEAYDGVKINSKDAFRCLADGTAYTMGEQVKLSAGLSASSIKNLTVEKNAISYKIEAITAAGVFVATHKALTALTGLMPSTADIIGTFAATTTYYLRLTVTDKITAAVVEFNIGQGKVLTSQTNRALGIGRDPRAAFDGIDIQDDLAFGGKLYNGVTACDLIIEFGGTTAKGYEKYLSGKMVQWVSFSEVNTNFNTSLGTCYYAGYRAMGNWSLSFYSVETNAEIAVECSAPDVFIMSGGVYTTHAGNTYLNSFRNQIASKCAVRVRATGRWKA